MKIHLFHKWRYTDYHEYSKVYASSIQKIWAEQTCVICGRRRRRLVARDK